MRRESPNRSLLKSETEEKFLNFCDDNKIERQVNYNKAGQNTYTIVFERIYLDSLEKKVVERCKELGIKYTFYRDKDVNHHYDFATMVTFDDTPEFAKVRLVSYDDILNKYQSRDSKPVQIVPKKWWEKLLSKLGLAKLEKSKVKEEMDYFFESLGFPDGFTKENVEDLKKLALPDYKEVLPRDRSPTLISRGTK
jgi:hypothetical protein